MQPVREFCFQITAKLILASCFKNFLIVEAYFMGFIFRYALLHTSIKLEVQMAG